MSKAKKASTATAEPESADPAETDGAPTPAAKLGGRRKLIVLVLPAALALLGAGCWYAGIPALLFGGKHAGTSTATASTPPIYVDLPEMIANLDSDPRRPRYIKLRARIEVHGIENANAVRSAMPRLEDLFQTYLRDMRIDDLRGSMGTYRLREELIARADIAAAPAQVADVLFVEMLVQ